MVASELWPPAIQYSVTESIISTLLQRVSSSAETMQMFVSSARPSNKILELLLQSYRIDRCSSLLISPNWNGTTLLAVTA